MATCAISATATDAMPIELTVVQRAQRGDEDAFAKLFELHRRRVYSVCLLMTSDPSEAEDLTQEAFLQVFRKVGTFRGDSAFSTWLHRVAVNTVLMRLRQRKSPPMLSLDEPVSPASPSLRHEFGQTDSNLSGTIDRIALRRAIKELPAGCRKIFVLHAIQGYQHQEIAKVLRCSIGNSKSQLYKAKLKMRDLLFPQRRSARRRNAVRMTDENGIRAGINNRSSESARSPTA
jgi:RNA polymerase sigma-70 factor, ECF subfamily